MVVLKDACVMLRENLVQYIEPFHACHESSCVVCHCALSSVIKEGVFFNGLMLNGVMLHCDKPCARRLQVKKRLPSL